MAPEKHARDASHGSGNSQTCCDIRSDARWARFMSRVYDVLDWMRSLLLGFAWFTREVLCGGCYMTGY